jgi:hypothetical protein
MAFDLSKSSDDAKKLNKEIKETLSLEEQILELLTKRKGIDSDILSDQQDISNVIKNQTKELKFQNEERRLIRSLSSQITKAAEKTYALSKDQLGLNKTNVDLTKTQKQLDEAIVLLEQQRVKLAKEGGNLNNDIAISLKEQQKEAKRLQGNLSKIAKDSKTISSNLGVKTFNAISDISGAIPGLRKFADPFKEAAEASRKQAANNLEAHGTVKKLSKSQAQANKQTNFGVDLYKDLRKGGMDMNSALKKAGVSAKQVKVGKLPTKASISPFMAGLKSIGPALKKAFGPMALLAELVQALIEGDKAAGDLAKSMNMTYTDAVRLRGEFGKMAADSGSIFVNTKGLQETYMAINKTLGTNAKISEDVLVQFTELREASGLTNEELTGIFKITQGTNKELNQVTGEVLAQAKISSANLGVTINEKEVLRDINKLSAATTLSLGKNPAILSKTVTTAKALGMTMEQIASSSESLLNFEQSIASELKAELLLGKDINLERARLAALNNNVAEVAKEISSQIGSAADFGKMNVIQQKALAESVGMSRDSLAETLFVQEQLRNVTGDEAEERKAVLDSLIQEKGLAEAQRQLAKGSIEDLKSQASIQDRFNKTMDKLREIFVQISEPILQIVSPIMDILVPILGVASKMMQPIMLVLRAVGNILGPLLDFSSIGDNYLEGVGKGFGAAGQNMMDGGVAAAFGPLGAVGYAAATSMNDGISTHGRRTLITPKGAFALNNNDTVIAGTNLFRGNDVYSGPEGAISVGADNKLLKELLEETKKANNTRREIGNKTVGALDEQGRRQIYSS